MSKGFLGKHHSKESKKKIREKHKKSGHIPPSRRGCKLSDEHKRKISEANKGISKNKGQIPWNKGKKGLQTSKYKGIPRPGYVKEKIRLSVSGDKNHNWQGGKSFESYSLDWTETLRRAIRERDNYTCQICGKTQIEELETIEKKLCVHHIDYNKKNCNPDNLLTLCQSCHSRLHNHRSRK